MANGAPHAQDRPVPTPEGGLAVELDLDGAAAPFETVGDPTPEVATVLNFIDCINRGDIDGIDALIADQHTMQMFNEPPEVGRVSVVEAWAEYLRSFPHFEIHPHSYTAHRGVAVLGHVTGSHVPFNATQPRLVTIIWSAQVECRRIVSWRLHHDTPRHRMEFGFPIN
jgi:hypothetical protein